METAKKRCMVCKVSVAYTKTDAGRQIALSPAWQEFRLYKEHLLHPDAASIRPSRLSGSFEKTGKSLKAACTLHDETLRKREEMDTQIE